jgi:hypothetical protein
MEKKTRSQMPVARNLRQRADDGLRTRDLQLGKLALYQLSYVRAGWDFITRDTALPLWGAGCREA